MLRACIGLVGCGDRDSATFVLDLVDVVKVGDCEVLEDERGFDVGVDTCAGGGAEATAEDGGGAGLEDERGFDVGVDTGAGGGAGATAEDRGGAGVTSGTGSGTGHAGPEGTTALAVAECNRLSMLLK